MPTAQDNIDENYFAEITAGTDIDFEKLLFRQMDRTMVCLTAHPDMFPFNVEATEALLWKYIDNLYLAEVERIKSDFAKLQNNVINRNVFSKSQGGKTKRITDPLKLDGILSKNEFFFSIEKLKAIMGIVKRSGFLPEESMEMVIGRDRGN